LLSDFWKDWVALKVLEQKGEEVTAVMSGIAGLQDVKLLRDFGQPNLNLTIDRR